MGPVSFHSRAPPTAGCVKFIPPLNIAAKSSQQPSLDECVSALGVSVSEVAVAAFPGQFFFKVFKIKAIFQKISTKFCSSAGILVKSRRPRQIYENSVC